MQHPPYAPASYIQPYAPSIDFWMAEPYGPDFSSLRNATTVMTAVKPAPIWLAQDAIDPSLIVPKAYWAIVNGTTGLFYFSWEAFRDSPAHLNSARQVFSELTALKGAVFGSSLDTLVRAPSGVTAMSRFNQGAAYIMAVNPTSQSVQGRFQVQGLAAGQQVNVMFENRTITASAGGFTDSFAGVARHVYSIASTNTTLASSISNKTGSTAARTWTMLALNGGLAAANSTSIANVRFTQTGGTACVPKVAAGAFPLSLGNLSPSQTATGNVVVDFTGCDSTSKFTVAISLSANDGRTTATSTLLNQRF
jgi:hypothetical protein